MGSLTILLPTGSKGFTTARMLLNTAQKNEITPKDISAWFLW
jgi:hypothetical protein